MSRPRELRPDEVPTQERLWEAQHFGGKQRVNCRFVTEQQAETFLEKAGERGIHRHVVSVDRQARIVFYADGKKPLILRRIA